MTLLASCILPLRNLLNLMFLLQMVLFSQVLLVANGASYSKVGFVANGFVQLRFLSLPRWFSQMALVANVSV